MDPWIDQSMVGPEGAVGEHNVCLSNQREPERVVANTGRPTMHQGKSSFVRPRCAAASRGTYVTALGSSPAR